MELPEEFKRVCRNMPHDIDRFVNSWDELVEHALIGIEAKDARVIRDFVDKVLARKRSPARLKSFWWQDTPAGMGFESGEDVATFLIKLKERLSKPPYKSEK